MLQPVMHIQGYSLWNLQGNCAVLRVTSIVSSTATASKDLILHLNTAMGGQPADATGTELQANSTVALNGSKFTNLYIYIQPLVWTGIYYIQGWENYLNWLAHEGFNLQGLPFTTTSYRAAAAWYGCGYIYH